MLWVKEPVMIPCPTSVDVVQLSEGAVYYKSVCNFDTLHDLPGQATEAYP